MTRLNMQAVRDRLNDPTLDPEAKRQAEEILRQLGELYEENPLQRFYPHTCMECDRYDNPACEKHRTPQLDFLKAVTKIVAAFAGNRFGKTTVLIVWILIQHAPLEMLPAHLKPFKLTKPGRPAMGRLLCPSEDAMIEYVIPALKQWCPKALLRGGSWEKAWSKQHSILYFADDCGQLSVYTYKQDPAVMVGAALDYVAYDEPPPEEHRKECLVRLIDRDGCERYALTPVNMKGGGIGWLRQKIWKRREDPNITVVKGDSYENRNLSREAIDFALAEYDESERLARRFGDFLHLGGMVYDGGFERCLIDPPPPKLVQGMDVIVAIDPGLRNAAFLWSAFGDDGEAIVFHEELVQNGTPTDYAKAIRGGNHRWGIKDPFYVIDPSARNRSQIDRRNVQQELADAGIPTAPAQNAVEAGVQQIRRRLQHDRIKVSRECRILRDQAEEYRIDDRPDEQFKVIKENDHHLDCFRYACMARPWYPPMDDRPAERLGFTPDFEGPYRPQDDHLTASPPMGLLS